MEVKGHVRSSFFSSNMWSPEIKAGSKYCYLLNCLGDLQLSFLIKLGFFFPSLFLNISSETGGHIQEIQVSSITDLFANILMPHDQSGVMNSENYRKLDAKCRVISCHTDTPS